MLSEVVHVCTSVIGKRCECISNCHEFRFSPGAFSPGALVLHHFLKQCLDLLHLRALLRGRHLPTDAQKSVNAALLGQKRYEVRRPVGIRVRVEFVDEPNDDAANSVDVSRRDISVLKKSVYSHSSARSVHAQVKAVLHLVQTLYECHQITFPATES